MAPPAAASGPWAFWRSLGSPRFVCAPMVDQSELAFRSLTRQLGVGLAYTPMLHARLMVEHPAYRTHTFDPDPAGREGPVFAQLAGHDPAVLLEAGRFVQGHVDAVDLNFGCPQARKGCRRWWPATSCRAVMDRPGCAVPARANAVFLPPPAASPQAIARKGRYGAFLLDEPELVVSLVGALARGLDVPVTAKVSFGSGRPVAPCCCG